MAANCHLACIVKSLGWFILASFVLQGVRPDCHHPGKGAHVVIKGQAVNDSTSLYATRSELEPSCEAGYELFYKKTRVCLENGTWTGREPFCAVKVKASVSSDSVSDGYYDSCSENEENATLEFVFFEAVVIDVVVVAFEWTSNDNEFDISLSHQDGSLVELGRRQKPKDKLKVVKDIQYQEYTLHLASPKSIKSVQVIIHHTRRAHAIFKICDISWYSKTAQSPSKCSKQSNTYQDHRIYSNKCYIVSKEVLGWKDAQIKCQEDAEDGSGSLAVVSEGNVQLMNFLQEMMKDKGLVSNMVFVQNPGLEVIQDPCYYLFYNRTEVFNVNGNCQHLQKYYICEKDIPICGQPDQKENSLLKLSEDGATAWYTCPPKHKMYGNETRRCQKGQWTGQAPHCTAIQCGMPQNSLDTSYKLWPEKPTVDSCMTMIKSMEGFVVKEWYKCGTNGKWTKKRNCTCYQPQNTCPSSDDTYRIIIGSVIGIVTAIIATTWVLVGIYVWRYQGR